MIRKQGNRTDLLWTWAPGDAEAPSLFDHGDKATPILQISILVLGLLRNSVLSGLHVQVDFCAHPLPILFAQQCADQSLATIRIGKQCGHTGSPLELLVQALRSIGGSHAHPMAVWQIEYSKPLWQIHFSPSGEFGVTHLPLLERHVKQALDLVGIAGIEDARICLVTGAR